jgi:hypothetical protein
MLMRSEVNNIIQFCSVMDRSRDQFMFYIRPQMCAIKKTKEKVKIWCLQCVYLGYVVQVFKPTEQKE